MKKTISVMGTPDMAVELSSVISTHTDNNVIIIDLDTMHPSLDLLMNVSPNLKRISSMHSDNLNTGLNIALDAVDKKLLTRELFLECTQNKRKNLFVLTGNYEIDNYEYMRVEPLEVLIRKAGDIFDIVILLLNPDIYDSYTIKAVQQSDMVIVPITGDLLNIRNINNDLDFLMTVKDIPEQKFIQVLFNYDVKHELSPPVVKKLCRFQFKGIIPYSVKRKEYHNRKKAYIKCMDKKILKQYLKIINKCGIKTIKPFSNKPQRIRNLFKSLTMKKNSKKGVI